MNDIDRAVHGLLKESLFPEKMNEGGSLFDNEKGVDLKGVFSEMTAHAVEALPYDLLSRHEIADGELYREWLNKCLSRQGSWLRLMYAQEQLLKLFEENGIACAVIKGSAAAMAYPDPSLRSAGDVDILVKRSDYERAEDIMKQKGYKPSHKPNDHHASFEKDGVSFEVHRRLPIISDENEGLISLFEKGIDERETGYAGPFSFPVLPKDLNGLSLVFHIDQHLRSGLGLRQVIDWMMFVNAHGGYESMRPMLKNTGTELLADTLTAMCRKYLGLREPAEDSGVYPCDELMEYITEKGNFGRKSGITGKAASAFLQTEGPVGFFRRLQTIGSKRWKAAQKYPILRPFAWIYQSSVVLKKAAADKVTLSDLTDQRKNGNAQKELIHKLGLDVDRMISEKAE